MGRSPETRGRRRGSAPWLVEMYELKGAEVVGRWASWGGRVLPEGEGLGSGAEQLVNAVSPSGWSFRRAPPRPPPTVGSEQEPLKTVPDGHFVSSSQGRDWGCFAALDDPSLSYKVF